MGKERSSEFEDWWEKHQHPCHFKFQGSSGSIDATGLLNIFQRSIESYGIWYVKFLGVGNTKLQKLLLQEAVYGNVEVQKLECLGHVQKQLPSCLRSLERDCGRLL